MSECKCNNNVVEIKFAKVKPGAKIPSKENENAGYDIYACFNEDYILINPHETVMIPTGIASACSEEYYFQLFERGSTGTKGMAQRCGVIDSSYRDEWFVPITNTTDKTIVISKLEEEKLCDKFKATDSDLYSLLVCVGLVKFIIYPYSKAICQAVLLPVPKTNVVEIPYEELKSIPSSRGIGKLGSSGK